MSLSIRLAVQLALLSLGAVSGFNCSLGQVEVGSESPIAQAQAINANLPDVPMPVDATTHAVIVGVKEPNLPVGAATEMSVLSPLSARCGDAICQTSENCSICARDCLQASGVACPRVGMMYSIWHGPASFAMKNLKAANRPQLTVTEVQQAESRALSGATSNLASMLQTPGQVGIAANFYYQHVPQAGFYCIYSQRQPGALHYNASLEGTYYGNRGAPDCPEATAILRQHAQQLVMAGIDYVVVDMTNIEDYGGAGDMLQLRPFEVLLSTWAAMRAAGEATPDVAAWQRLAAGAAPAQTSDANALSTYVLDLYRQKAYAGLLLRTSAAGKAIFFYPTATIPDASRVAALASDAGWNDVQPVPLWTHQSSAGTWSFMEPCLKFPNRGIQPVAGGCGQARTLTSLVGSQMAISPSYQIGYASTAGQAIGHYRGYVLRQQFADAWAAQPDWLLLSSWNEHIAQPQPSSSLDMGLETDTSVVNASFVDTFGVEFSRDLEPTLEEGSRLYDLMASCIRIFRRGMSQCDDPQELCCQQPEIDQFMRFHGTAAGEQYGTARGQFGYYPNSAVAPAATRPLYACPGVPGDALSTTVNGCAVFPQATGAAAATPVLLGAIASALGAETLRQLWICQGLAGVSYSLSGSCGSGDTRGAFLGYVR